MVWSLVFDDNTCHPLLLFPYISGNNYFLPQKQDYSHCIITQHLLIIMLHCTHLAHMCTHDHSWQNVKQTKITNKVIYSKPYNKWGGILNVIKYCILPPPTHNLSTSTPNGYIVMYYRIMYSLWFHVRSQCQRPSGLLYSIIRYSQSSLMHLNLLFNK